MIEGVSQQNKQKYKKKIYWPRGKFYRNALARNVLIIILSESSNSGSIPTLVSQVFTTRIVW